MIGEFLRRLRYCLYRRQFEAELDAPAQRQFGNITLLQEESRVMWTGMLGSN